MSEAIETVGLAEAIALRLFPDYHAFPMKLYFGDVKMSVSDWKDAYAEMQSKPTDVSKESWRAERQEKFKRED